MKRRYTVVIVFVVLCLTVFLLIYLRDNSVNDNTIKIKTKATVINSSKKVKYGSIDYIVRNMPNTFDSTVKLFILDISKDKGIESSKIDFTNIEYLSSGFQKDIKLLVNKDTIPCTIFHFENFGSTTPYLRFEIGFRLTNNDSMYKLLINDKIYNKKLIVI